MRKITITKWEKQWEECRMKLPIGGLFSLMASRDSHFQNAVEAKKAEKARRWRTGKIMWKKGEREEIGENKAGV